MNQPTPPRPSSHGQRRKRPDMPPIAPDEPMPPVCDIGADFMLDIRTRARLTGDVETLDWLARLDGRREVKRRPR